VYNLGILQRQKVFRTNHKNSPNWSERRDYFQRFHKSVTRSTIPLGFGIEGFPRISTVPSVFNNFNAFARTKMVDVAGHTRWLLATANFTQLHNFTTSQTRPFLSNPLHSLTTVTQSPHPSIVAPLPLLAYYPEPKHSPFAHKPLLFLTCQPCV